MICDLNFEEVGIIDVVIRSFNTDNTQKVVESLVEKLEAEVNSAFSWYDKTESDAKEVCQKTQQRATADAEKLMRDATESHDKTMANLKKEKNEELSRNEERPSTRNLDCLKKAMQLARFENVDSAIEMRLLAQERLKEHREERAQRILQTYEHLMDHEVNKYNQEVHLIRLNLKLAISLAAQKLKEEIDIIRKRAAAMIREQVRKAIGVGVKKLEKPEKRPQLSASLRGFVKTKVAKDQREYIFAP
jgi:hypothetical protein